MKSQILSFFAYHKDKIKREGSLLASSTQFQEVPGSNPDKDVQGKICSQLILSLNHLNSEVGEGSYQIPTMRNVGKLDIFMFYKISNFGHASLSNQFSGIFIWSCETAS